MCHPGLSQVRSEHQELAAQRRWLHLQVAIAAAAAEDSTARSSEGGGSGGGGREDGEGRVNQYCICSPTQHPGSFRCRLHRATQFTWAGRAGRETLIN